VFLFNRVFICWLEKRCFAKAKKFDRKYVKPPSPL